jgi:hypothetical protein
MSDFITILEAYVGVDTGLFRHIKHRQKRKKRAHEVLLEELLMNYTKTPRANHAQKAAPTVQEETNSGLPLVDVLQRFSQHKLQEPSTS